MRLPPLFRYFGSKWRSAARYPSPNCDLIIEPFAGGAGYSLLYHWHDVILVEKDRTLVAVWKWLLAASAEEIMELPLIRPGESIAGYNIRQEAKDWIGYWNTISGTKPQPRMVPSATRIPSSFWGAHIRERTAQALQHIRHWNIIEGDYTVAPDVRATYFVDAPYQHGERYGHRALNYTALKAWCLRRRGQVVVAENSRADWLPFKSLGDLHAAPRAQGGGAASRRSLEAYCHWDSKQLLRKANRGK